MSTHWEFDCTGGQGSSASFVTQVNVYVDGVLVAVRTHTPVEGEAPTWSFTVPLSLDGTHTVRVTDFDAGHGETEFSVSTTTLVCDVATTTTSAPTTTQPPVTVTQVGVTETAAPTTTVVAVIPSEATTIPATTATVLAETVTAAPATLPATGSNTEPLLGAGFGFLAVGVLAATVARRFRRV